MGQFKSKLFRGAIPRTKFSVHESPYQTLRQKWAEVPATCLERQKTTEMVQWTDEKLYEEWTRLLKDNTEGDGFVNRKGWVHALYADGMKGKKLLDVGCGLGFDGIVFAQHGARVTFVDLAESNLKVVQRICRKLKLHDVNFCFLEHPKSLEVLDADYDVVLAMGSLHHAPLEVIKEEARELLRHLKIGGRWIQLAYPKVRWIKEGKFPFHEWGEITDGEGTPWAEWYDLPKLLNLLAPARFNVVLSREYCGQEFIWFDLLYRGI